MKQTIKLKKWQFNKNMHKAIYFSFLIINIFKGNEKIKEFY